ncbi:60S ribosomal protein L10A [Reticulomyxa filosa]|uniref:60S ribosomal protein L10A n=1 Tax=Reticulomyxa filosa TaxID=46433 RepID=X6NWW4_RETFI|nr:60S ribosomal protein L10A [Reticulomyxa filosa]|eukprot:ETO29782.1 60S ribosomal protein L10A [Reticulomyxa filosa]
MCVPINSKKLHQEILKDSIAALLHHSKNVKKRQFVETVEIHFGLKNFDPARDKRLQGQTSLPHAPRKKFRCLVLGNEEHLDEAKALGLDSRSLDELKKINRDKKIVKNLAKSYDQLIASATIIRQVPRLLGPTLNKMGKFPAAMRPNEKIQERVEGMNKQVKFSVKFKVGAPMCMSGPVGHVEMTPEQLEENITATVNYVISLMKKSWQNVKKVKFFTLVRNKMSIHINF